VLAPTTTVRVDGTGWIESSNRIEWTVEGQQAVTAIINFNWYALSTVQDRVVDDFLPALFEGLHDADVSYRLAIVMNSAGDVTGDTAYIDDSFTVDEALDAAGEMLEGGANTDNDAGLQTLLNAIEENSDWLLDDDPLWFDSRLNLMVVNSDVEQSPGNAEHYLDSYDDYKDRDNIAVHGIAGDPATGGCSGSGLYAEGSQNLWEAVDNSGGVFMSFCTSDWAAGVPAFIDGFTGTIETFVLTGNPAPWSIEVRIDGVELFEGWTYDEKTKQVVFDAATYPERGSTLRIDYLMAVSCD